MKAIAALALLLFACTLCWPQDQTQTQPQVPDAVAQDVKALREMAREDRSTIDAVVMYPEEMRDAIFEVAAHPELLARLARMHRTASASFQRVVSCVTPPEQKMAYDIARYPGLASDLLDAQNRSIDFQTILIKYPTAIHSAAMALATERGNCPILSGIYDLQTGVDAAYRELMAESDGPLLKATDMLLSRPEILAMLLDSMDQTILIGNIYRKDAAFVRKRAAEIGKTVGEQNQKAQSDWKNVLASNPMALSELKKAAADFATANKYDFSSKMTDALMPPAYSFWYGYPPGAAWYSYPDYLCWGFYEDKDGSTVLASLPSGAFIEWLDPAAYPQLSGAILKQYRDHENLSGGFYSAVRAKLQSMKEAPPVPVNDTARRLAEGLKLKSPTDVELNYKAADYWMSTTYMAVKEQGGIGGIQRR